MPTTGNVLSKIPMKSKHQVQSALAAGLFRAGQKHGVGSLADAMGCVSKTVENAINKRNLPELDTVFNALRLDQSVLDELFAEFGLKVVALNADECANARFLADIAGLGAVVADALADGRIDHREEQDIAEHMRPLAREMAARVAVADRKRAAA